MSKTDTPKYPNNLGRRLTVKEYNRRINNLRKAQEARGPALRDKRMVHWAVALIRDERIRQGIAVHMLAAAAGLKAASYSNYEDGRNTCRALLNIEDMLAFLGYRLTVEPIPQQAMPKREVVQTYDEHGNPPHMALARQRRETRDSRDDEKKTSVEQMRLDAGFVYKDPAHGPTDADLDPEAMGEADDGTGEP